MSDYMMFANIYATLALKEIDKAIAAFEMEHGEGSTESSKCGELGFKLICAKNALSGFVEATKEEIRDGQTV